MRFTTVISIAVLALAATVTAGHGKASAACLVLGMWCTPNSKRAEFARYAYQKRMVEDGNVVQEGHVVSLE
jgi:hypothetical protein